MADKVNKRSSGFNTWLVISWKQTQSGSEGETRSMQTFKKPVSAAALGILKGASAQKSLSLPQRLQQLTAKK